MCKKHRWMSKTLCWELKLTTEAYIWHDSINMKFQKDPTVLGRRSEGLPARAVA